MTRTLKVIPLALLLLFPAASRLRAVGGFPAGDDKHIVVAGGDGVFALDGDGDGAFVLRSHGGLHGGRVGVRLIQITPELRAHYGAPRDAGVLVGEVVPDSPAAKAGIQVGDILTAADGDRVDSAWDLSATVRGKKEGDTVKIDVIRDRSARSFNVGVEERREPWIEPRVLRKRIRDRIRVIPDVDVRLGDLGRLEDLGTLRERLEEMEKRLKDLEKKLPSR